jgi:tetratricopeptide (TPR) repeat protein
MLFKFVTTVAVLACLAVSGNAAAETDFDKCMVNPWVQKRTEILPICMKVREDKTLTKNRRIEVLNRLAYGAYLDKAYQIEDLLTNEVLSLDPENLEAKVTKIWSVLTAGDPVAAADMFTDLIAEHPESARGYFGLAWMYEEYGQRDKAIQAYKQAIAAEPGYLKSYMNLATAYNRKRDFIAAHQTLDTVLAMDDKVLRAVPYLSSDPFEAELDFKDQLMTARAHYFFYEGRFDDALKALVLVADRFPKSGRMLEYIARARFRSGDVQGALRDAMASNRLGTCNQCAATVEVDALIALKRYQEASDRAEKALMSLHTDQDQSHLLQALGKTSKRLRKYPEALAYYRSLSKYFGNEPWPFNQKLIREGYYDGKPTDQYNEKADNALQACVLDPECFL